MFPDGPRPRPSSWVRLRTCVVHGQEGPGWAALEGSSFQQSCVSTEMTLTDTSPHGLPGPTGTAQWSLLHGQEWPAWGKAVGPGAGRPGREGSSAEVGACSLGPRAGAPTVHRGCKVTADEAGPCLSLSGLPGQEAGATPGRWATALSRAARARCELSPFHGGRNSVRMRNEGGRE